MVYAFTAEMLITGLSVQYACVSNKLISLIMESQFFPSMHDLTRHYTEHILSIDHNSFVLGN